jgi:hypothetical protein
MAKKDTETDLRICTECGEIYVGISDCPECWQMAGMIIPDSQVLLLLPPIAGDN